MKTKKPVYKIDDKVKIVNPMVFLRVGYPLGLIETKDKLDAEKLALFLYREYQVNPWIEKDYTKAGYKFWFDKVLGQLAYAVISSKLFGGTTRSIHTELKEELRGKEGYVRAKKIVVTGEYNSGNSGYDYWGEYDSNPPYLSDSKRHVILELEIPVNGFFAEPIWIEAANVELVKEEVSLLAEETE